MEGQLQFIMFTAAAKKVTEDDELEEAAMRLAERKASNWRWKVVWTHIPIQMIWSYHPFSVGLFVKQLVGAIHHQLGLRCQVKDFFDVFGRLWRLFLSLEKLVIKEVKVAAVRVQVVKATVVRGVTSQRGRRGGSTQLTLTTIVVGTSFGPWISAAWRCHRRKSRSRWASSLFLRPHGRGRCWPAVGGLPSLSLFCSSATRTGWALAHALIVIVEQLG